MRPRLSTFFPRPEPSHRYNAVAENANHIGSDDEIPIVGHLCEDGGGDGTEDERNDAATGGQHGGTASGRGSGRAGRRALEASASASRLRASGRGGGGGTSGGAQSWAGHSGVAADGVASANGASSSQDGGSIARGRCDDDGREVAWVAAGRVRGRAGDRCGGRRRRARSSAASEGEWTVVVGLGALGDLEGVVGAADEAGGWSPGVLAASRGGWKTLVSLHLACQSLMCNLQVRVEMVLRSVLAPLRRTMVTGCADCKYAPSSPFDSLFNVPSSGRRPCTRWPQAGQR